MIYILGSTKRGAEFATAHAINEMCAASKEVGMAVVPREPHVETKRDPRTRKVVSQDIVDRPMFSGMICLAVAESLWHEITRRGQFGIMAPIRKVDEIDPREWRLVQEFFQRAEAAAERRHMQFDADMRVASYKKGDRIRILGDLLDGRLRDAFGVFIRLDKDGRIVARVEGIEMMGKSVTAIVTPAQAMAAE